ncbi:MAG TPA: hypothetical protein VII66_12045, partial [Gemmatimonadaceae bacterium]
MLSHRSFCIGLLLLPALPAFGQTTALPHRRIAHATRTSAPVASPQVRAIVLPVDGLATDSVQTIITRDLSYGDRVRVVSDDQAHGTNAATAIVKAVATPQGVTVSLIDPLSGAVRQQHDFPLAIVSARNDQAIADSLNQAFAARDLMRRTQLARAEGVRDSLQAEMAKKAPRLRSKKAEQEYTAVVAQRDSMLRDALSEVALVQGEGQRDEASRAGAQSAAIAHELVVRDSMVHARRWAIHGVSDAV